MTRDKLKQLLPSKERLKSNVFLRLTFGSRLFDPYLWYLNKNTVSVGIACGFVVGYLPIPMQMLLVTLLALLFRFNLPASLGMVWISNPLTWVALYYPGYRLGAFLLNEQTPPPDALSVEWLMSQYPPLFLGCAIIGLTGGVLCLIITRLLWRLHIVRRWQARRLRMKIGNRR